MKKLLIPLLPDSVLGSNWSAPNAKLHGLMPEAPITSKQKPTSKNIICPGVGPTHIGAGSWFPHSGGWSFVTAAVNVKTSIPCKLKKRSGN